MLSRPARENRMSGGVGGMTGGNPVISTRSALSASNRVESSIACVQVKHGGCKVAFVIGVFHHRGF